MHFNTDSDSSSRISLSKRKSIDLELLLEKAKQAELDKKVYEAAECYFEAGKLDLELLNPKGALISFEQAFINFEKEEDWENCLETNAEIVAIHRELESFDHAIRVQTTSLTIVKKLGDLEREYQLQFEVGMHFQALMDFEAALQQYKVCHALAQQLESPFKIKFAQYNMGNIYNWMNNYDLAEEYLLKGINSLDETDELRTRLYFYGSYGILLNKFGKFQEALVWFDRVLVGVEGNEGFESLKFNILKSKGILYFDWHKYTESISILQEAEQFGKEIKSPVIHSIVFEYLSKCYEILGEHEKSLQNLKKHIEVQKQVFNQSLNVREKNILLRYEMEEAQRDNELYRLKNIDLVLANKEIAEQKQEIETKNKNITESIEYARNIQEGILPDPQLFRTFAESFVFYKPKDIIGGDFYWMAQKGNVSVLAVADCTGHGVPGALMSMIGHNLLNQVVNEMGIIEPDKILHFLNQGIHRIFNQNKTGRRTYDGMDIALLTIDKAKEEVQFASAMRPAFYFQRGELHKLEPNKNPIGGIEADEAIFTAQTIPYKPGDSFYLFSDGFADQFGGPDGRKFMMRRFRELIVSIAHLPMKKQFEEIEQAFLVWQGFLEQVDDVLILGIRIS
jgi:serine phosphatase RsbU (regulator of sigma subunit)